MFKMRNFTWCITLLICTLLVNNNPLADNHLRIIGGYEAKIEDHPWIVLLESKLGYFSYSCGGSLLNEDTVLTAAHCFNHSKQWSIYSILAGTHDITQPGMKIQVKDVKIHEYYRSSMGINNDIAIVKLAQKVEFSNKIQPARLPNQDDQLPEGAPLLAAGWGKTKMNVPKGSDVLKAVRMEVLPQETCTNEGWLNKVICAGDIINGAAYEGDSGGPLEYDGVVVGVSSYGVGPFLCGAFTSVADYRRWIDETIHAF
ncbi:mast cell protease 1A isoform X1 [Diabrotica virgifera virgifera]|uniref:Mast cell protease 1A-like isoform X1 n=1 Tax=Diabrotica virgifera virgifera TaxID=50390 RepID=A0A6P7FMP0_DIAVI|nr:mast cell protease 1A isoform X1 [Diabrotica virgifera virgifera]